MLNIKNSKYKICKTLGKGAYGETLACIDSNGKELAIKRVKIDRKDEYFHKRVSDIKREIIMLMQMKKQAHPAKINKWLTIILHGWLSQFASG